MIAFWNFGQLYNSFFYMSITAYLLIMFVVVSCLSKRISDRVLILFGWIFAGGGIVFLLFSSFLQTPHITLWQFGLGVGIFVTSSASFETAVPSLYSKLVSKIPNGDKLQGSSQAVLQTAQSFAILIAPLVSAPILNAGLKWVMVTILVLWVISFVNFCVAFKHLYTNDMDKQIMSVPETLEIESSEDERVRRESERLLNIK